MSASTTPHRGDSPVVTTLDVDKAAYAPGTPVQCTATLSHPHAGQQLVVKYYHLGKLLSQQTVPVTSTSTTWTWAPPKTDYRGYLIHVAVVKGNQTMDQAATAVDVSSDWQQFPRYGFLSKFGKLSNQQMDAVIGQLNRYHINGLQFYDWGDTHHRSLAGTPERPAAEWKDLASRPTYLATVKGYIDRAHQRGMKAMFYNLLYGAYPNTTAEGVKPEWGLYMDSLHTKRYAYAGFPASWETPGLDITNPGNPDWQRYLLNNVDQVYKAARALPFDGWHVDQLGDPGKVYTYAGQRTDPSNAFGSFLKKAKQTQATRPLVMNAVNQWGQEQIAQAPVEFLYSELWTGNEQYQSLGQAIQYNEKLAPTKRTVLAAYVNREKSNAPGLFNPASVLMADAVIFAFGGAHIELGEHMLDTDYFPNDKLQLTPALQQQVQAYYDFAVAYENLLRGQGRTFSDVKLTGNPQVAAWPPQLGKIAAVGAQWQGKQVVHLLNFTDATTLEWRDNKAQQPVPSVRRNVAVRIATSNNVTRAWWASPDFQQGVPQELKFTQANGLLSLTLPQLQYWDMLVLE
ncbi:glycoside hydrolase family 66 protein [Hymenobacter tenuis]